MIAKQPVKTTTIPTGAARAEGRQPSHDGESLTLYYVPGDLQWLLEDNGGIAATNDEPGGGEDDSQWEAILEEAAQDRAQDRGELATRCGGQASDLMVEMGWVAEDPESPEERHTIQHEERRRANV